MSGLFVGAFAGVIRSRTPVLFATASGIQWFALGTTFTASRPLVQRAWGEDRNTYRDRVSISAAAGSITGAVGGLLRKSPNLPHRSRTPSNLVYRRSKECNTWCHRVCLIRRSWACSIRPGRY